jgi:hypothetical protein
MRNFLLSVCALLATSSIHAQEHEPLSRVVLKLSPQHFIGHAFKGGVERFNRTHSSSVTFFFTAQRQNTEEGFFQYGHDGLAGELQFRKYIKGMKQITSKTGKVHHRGIYGAGYLQAGSYSGQLSHVNTVIDPVTGVRTNQWAYRYKESIGNWGFGFTIGFQKTLWQALFLDAFVGGGMQFSDRIVTGNPQEEPFFNYIDIYHPAYNGILPKIGMTIGLGI